MKPFAFTLSGTHTEDERGQLAIREKVRAFGRELHRLGVVVTAESLELGGERAASGEVAPASEAAPVKPKAKGGKR